MGRRGLEPRTNFFFSFKKSAKTFADYIRVLIGFENIRYCEMENCRCIQVGLSNPVVYFQTIIFFEIVPVEVKDPRSKLRRIC